MKGVSFPVHGHVYISSLSRGNATVSVTQTIQGKIDLAENI